MRIIILTLLALFVASPAMAAWADTWSSDLVGVGKESDLDSPGTQTTDDFSNAVECNSSEGCSLTVDGAGTYEIWWFTGTDDTNTAHYSPTGVTLTDTDKVIDLTRGRKYRAKVTVVGAANLKMTGN